MSSSIKELDFFSSNHQKTDFQSPKEIENKDGSLKESFININTRLDVHTSSFEERPTVELKTLQDKLEKLKDENRQLRSMLESVTQSYTSLQSQIHAEEQKAFINHPQSPSRQQLKKQKLFCALDVNKPLQRDQDEGQERSSSPPENDREDLLNNEKDNNIIRVYSGDDNDGPEQASLSPENQGNDGSEKAPGMSCKKARVSIRTQSDAPLVTDGCQWRKYGQKVAKNNPCPRAYYRCTMGIGCPVRKQVQRCAQDSSILITTYEGKHNHPLLPAATAVANMTSAAASMLLSSSKTSNSSPSSTIGCYGLLPSFPFNTTMATPTSSSQIPTITLDLTQPPSNHMQFQRPSLSFSSSSSSSSNLHGCQQLEGHPLYIPSKLPMMMPSLPDQSQDQTSLVDTITAAIAANPNFTSAVAAAISSVLGTRGNTM